MPVYKLHYFNAKGRAEVARMIMAYGDIEYEDIRWEKEKWLEFKPKTPFGKIPVLEIGDKMISQSGAINDYLAKQAGLYGENDMEAAKIRMVCDQSEEMLKALVSVFYEQDAERKAAMKKKYEEEQLPQFMASFEKYLEHNNCSGHFVGDKMSLADILVVYHLPWSTYIDIPIHLEKYPKLQAVNESVNNNPKIAAWIEKRPKTEI